MINSILGSIKQMLGIDQADTSFDDELIMHTNGALMIMTQLGVGPSGGFMITSASEEWTDLLGDRTDLNLVFTDTYLRVRQVFDPPQNSFLVTAIEKQIAEYDWRIEAWHKPELGA
ncbi:MAG: hypothetical protein PHX43_03860 [Alphaproteobacteria bacterium]|nr:hypothetical protein [Alphaproteobacteria bacterium]